MSRQTAPIGAAEFVSLDRPFSNFEFVEERFTRSYPVARIFSQIRSRDCKTLIIEDIAASGAVLDENAEIARLVTDYEMRGLKRLSFWKIAMQDGADLSTAESGACIGYALLKHDFSPSRERDAWHVFESVISKVEHRHNYSPCAKPVRFRVMNAELVVVGVIAGQQNGLNKACAQVALRSVCANYLEDHDLTFSRINELAFAPGQVTKPWDGLSSAQVSAALNGLGINFVSINYQGSPDLREALPYQRTLYSGIESGCGGLLVFSPQSQPEHGVEATMHMIACFGHTFNEDTWAPNAEKDYFHIDGNIRYIPSDSWTSSFLIHDDNFGSNLCIPKAYLDRKVAEIVIVLLPKGYVYDALMAEATAADIFYSVAVRLEQSQNPWFHRMVDAAVHKKLILRVVPVTREQYLAHLEAMSDWQLEKEKSETLTLLGKVVCARMWMVEVSIPDLFSTNKRKIGELLLDASLDIGDEANPNVFVLARFPGAYLLPDKIDPNSVEREFLSVPSDLLSHTELFSK